MLNVEKEYIRKSVGTPDRDMVSKNIFKNSNTSITQNVPSLSNQLFQYFEIYSTVF